MKPNHKIILSHNCGFFSDFLTGLAGIMYCYDNGFNFFVEWKNKKYSSNPNDNLFDKYFFQELDGSEKFEVLYRTITPYRYYFHAMKNFTNGDIYKFLKKPSELLTELNILNNGHFTNIKSEMFSNKKILGIHKRGTDHSLHGKKLDDVYILNEINDELKKNSYDNVFLITDDMRSFDFFSRELGSFLITTDSYKSYLDTGIHFENSVNGHRLATEVIRDSYLLSKTTYKLISRSNVSLFSLLCNLDKENFRYIDNHITYV